MGNKELKKINWVAIACGFILVLQAIASFPTVGFYGRTIRLFAFEGMFRGDFYHARVLGNYVLETEHGHIRLGHGSVVLGASNSIIDIDVENFVNGRSSHNLVVDGIDMPQNISVAFRTSPNRISILLLYDQEIVVSGVPLVAYEFNLTHPRDTADIVVEFAPPEYVILADTTPIHFVPSRYTGRPFSRVLHIYNNDELWRIVGRTAVRVLGETEFTEFRSITFRPDWGEFITGELFE